MTTHADELPETSGARAKAIGELGVELALTLARAGARSLFAGSEGEGIWSAAHRDGAAATLRSLGRLRGAAAKIGQMMAQRPGALPDAYVDTLSALTDDIPPMSYALVKAQIENELDARPTELFASFDREPLAAASLGQVHGAMTHEGASAVVKVQYPAVAESVRADIASLSLLLPLLERAMGRDDLRSAFVDVTARLEEELDYRKEAESVEAFRALFVDPAGDAPYVIPEVHPTLSTGKVLTLSRVEGVSLRRFLDERPSSARRATFAEHVTRFMCTAVFRHRILHVDPNPGNYLFRADDRLGVVDFGAVKRFGASFVASLRVLLRTAGAGSDGELDEVLVSGGLVSRDAPQTARRIVRALARAWSLPVWKAGFSFDRAYVEEVAALQNAAARESALSLAPEWLFWARQMLGMTFLLHKLDGSYDMRPLFEEHLADPP
jgi:aarF domain-containing kinase